MNHHRTNIRLFIQSHLESGNLVSLETSQAHYLSNVMRCKESDIITVFNGYDGQWTAALQSLNKNNATISILKKILNQPKEHNLTLAFAPVKNVTPSFIVQKATELSVTKIQPITTERTIVRKINLTKLNIAAIEAAEQSERLLIPKIEEIKSLVDLLKKESAAYKKILFCDERHNPNNRIYNELSAITSDNNLILVGPEGGFTNQEKELIRSSPNAQSLSLGKNILRSETAIIAALSLYQAICTACESS